MERSSMGKATEGLAISSSREPRESICLGDADNLSYVAPSCSYFTSGGSGSGCKPFLSASPGTDWF
jgi:hypothetical protein